MTALFSLVVPTYNVERYLDEFLASLAEQSYPVSDIEIVFVDDGSTDSSAEIIAKWIAVDRSIGDAAAEGERRAVVGPQRRPRRR